MKLILTSAIFLLSIVLLFLGLQNQHDKTMFLANKLTELKGYMKYRDCVNIEVSKVPVAWHLDHSLRTINEIYKAVKNSDPEQYRSDINLGRSLVLFTNKIPRGKAKAPTIVVPPDTIYTDSLQLHFNEAWTTMKAYDSLPKKAFFTHPYLGFLKKRTAKRFIEIHTEHHLKIIRDILKE